MNGYHSCSAPKWIKCAIFQSLPKPYNNFVWTYLKIRRYLLIINKALKSDYLFKYSKSRFVTSGLTSVKPNVTGSYLSRYRSWHGKSHKAISNYSRQIKCISRLERFHALYIYYVLLDPDHHSLSYGKDQHEHHIKHLIICCMEEDKITTWVWVNKAWMFIFR